MTSQTNTASDAVTATKARRSYVVTCMGGVLEIKISYREDSGGRPTLAKAKRCARSYINGYSQNKERGSHARWSIAELTLSDFDENGKWWIDI